MNEGKKFYQQLFLSSVTTFKVNFFEKEMTSIRKWADKKYFPYLTTKKMAKKRKILHSI